MSYQKITVYAFKLTVYALLFTVFSNFGYSLPKTNIQQMEVAGYYYLEGKAAKAFPEIAHIELSTTDYKGNPSPLNGSIRVKQHKFIDYKFINITLKGKTLSLTTKKIKGIYYKFTGKFVPDSISDSSNSEVVLKGNLTKIQAEKIVAQQYIELTYFTGD